MKYLFILILLISCAKDEDMIFQAMLPSNSTEDIPIPDPEEYGFVWSGQSNSVSMEPKEEMDAVGFPELTPIDGFFDGWEAWNHYAVPIALEPSREDMNGALNESFIGVGAQQRLIYNLLGNGHITNAKSVMVSKSGEGIAIGEGFYPWGNNILTGAVNGLITQMNESSINFTDYIWIQGENDTVILEHAEAYEQNLTDLIHVVRTGTNNPDLRFYIIKLYDFTGTDAKVGKDLVKAAQEAVCAADSNVFIVRNDYDLPLKIENTPDLRSHYGSIGQNRLGELIEKAVVKNTLNRPFTDEMYVETTSTSATWRATSIVNNGTTLTWVAEINGVKTIKIGNNPTFDLSGNTGTATIKIQSSTYFANLTEMEFGALGITRAVLNYGEDLTKLVIIENPNLEYMSIEGMPNLTYIDASNNGFVYFYVQINPLLSYIDLSNNNLTVDIHNRNSLDKIFLQVNSFGTNNRVFDISNNTGVRTSASDTDKSSLISRGWTVTE